MNLSGSLRSISSISVRRFHESFHLSMSTALPAGIPKHRDSEARVRYKCLCVDRWFDSRWFDRVRRGLSNHCRYKALKRKEKEQVFARHKCRYKFKGAAGEVVGAADRHLLLSQEAFRAGVESSPSAGPSFPRPRPERQAHCRTQPSLTLTLVASLLVTEQVLLLLFHNSFARAAASLSSRVAAGALPASSSRRASKPLPAAQARVESG